MHKFASFNHKLFPADEINIKATSFAGLYGKGVFTTLAIYNSKPFLWEKHWRRLNDNAKKLKIDLSDINEQEVYNSLKQIIGQNEISNARCRLTFFDESSSKVWQNQNVNKTSLLIQTANSRESKQLISLTLSAFVINSNSPLIGVKSCNYLENVMALENAKEIGFDEAIRINERNEVVSACMANIFWLKGDQLFTPSLKTGCLAGTTREYILDKRDVFEVEESLNTLDDADAIFLTSAGIGITQTGKYNEKVFTRELNELTTLIKF
jgi:branched-subunit amino acid aminotransferase/4-amino-4-deoxychorismate lyase